MWHLSLSPTMMKHFTACKIQFSECRRLTLFSCVMTILTSWKGLCGYDRVDMSCQDFCTVCLLRTFPCHYSICKQHVIPAVQHLHAHAVFSCFLFSCDQAALWMVQSVRPSVRLSVCLSVRLSVTPFWLCSHHPIIMKFSGVITSDKSDVHAKGQGQRSKVKVTEVTTQLHRFRTVTPVWIHQWLRNAAQSLK